MTGLSLIHRKSHRVPELRGPAPLDDVAELLAEAGVEAHFIKPDESHRLLCDLASAASDLLSGKRSRVVIRLCVEPEAWELGLERLGSELLCTVFQGGDLPQVPVFEKRVDAHRFATRILVALRAREGHPFVPPASTPRRVPPPPLAFEARLQLLRTQLKGVLAEVAEPVSSELAWVGVEPSAEVPIVISADAFMRPSFPANDSQSSVQRSDLFSLLFRGKVRVVVGEHARELTDVHVFLFAEQLVEMVLQALESWSLPRSYHRRIVVGGAIVGLRVQNDGASLTLGVAKKSPSERGQTRTFPAVDMVALAHSSIFFGRALVRTLIRRDRAQSSNLRLHALRNRIRELSERVRESTRNDSIVNVSPEGYRAFAEAARTQDGGGSFGTTKLRFSMKWTCAVPSIDLRATFLCGNLFVVGAEREVIALDRRSGELVWRIPVPRAVSVMTPLGLARLEQDGTLRFYDLLSGDNAWTVRLSPRVGGGASGAVVSAPDLPRMLLVSEGTRHLTAIDLHSGEVRWRYGARRGKAFRVKRAGRLAIIASGEVGLTALDVESGEVVWRYCDRLRFASPVAVDHEAVFALAGEGAFVGRGGTRLHHLDAWSGVERWNVELPSHVAPVGMPLLSSESVILVTNDRRGTGLLGLDRATGRQIFEVTASTAACSCLLIDDLVVVNTEAGEVMAVSAVDGRIRYRHQFTMGPEGDRPRRLEPVLRSGALFIPQHDVQVIRPRDGSLLGHVPCELVPDLLRVDERCDVYIAEESGHVSAYAAAPRLTLVQG